MNQQAIDQVIKNVKFLLAKNKIDESLEILMKEIAPRHPFYLKFLSAIIYPGIHCQLN